MPVVNDVYVDPLLTNISVKYSNSSFIAEKIFPMIPVQKRTGFYFTYDKSNLKVTNDERSGVARANRVDFGLTKTAYGPLAEHSLEEAIDYDTRDQAQSPFDPRADAALHLTERITLNKENKLATMLNDTTVVTQNATLTGTSQWSDFANSDPFSDIQTAKDTIKLNALMPANAIWMGYQVWAKLKNHPDLLARLSVNTVRTLTVEMFAQLMEVPASNIFIGDAVQNTAADGQTDAMGYIWPKSFWLGYVTPQPGLRTVSAGYHLQLTNGRVIDRWDDQPQKAEFVRITDYYDPKIVATEAIYLIKNAVA